MSESLFYGTVRILLKPLFFIVYHTKIINKKVLQAKGPIIFCGNHLHVLDQTPLMLAYKKPIHYLAKKEYFDSKFKIFYKNMGCIPVDREGNSSKSKIDAIEILKKGGNIGIFPEGTRNKYENCRLKLNVAIMNEDKEKIIRLEKELNDIKQKYKEKNIIIKDNNLSEVTLLPFFSGAVKMAKETNATIIPFAITGGFKKFKPNILRLGKPYKVIGNINEENKLLEEKILNLVKLNRSRGN